MMQKLSTIFILFLAALAGAVALAVETVRTDSVMLPASKPSAKDIHDLHPKTKDGCSTCHKDVSFSKWASDRLIPKMLDCGRCHEEVVNVTLFSPFEEKCKKCHLPLKKRSRPTRGVYPRPNVRFSHVAHLSSKYKSKKRSEDKECATCHPYSVSGRARGKGIDVVGMKTCYRCHLSSGKNLSACRTCHLTYPDGRMKTEINDKVLFPPPWLKGQSHGPDWAGTHASQAGSDSEFCASCHKEKFCTDCHSGRRRPKNIHPGDWISTHGVSTRMDNPRCQSCHRSQSFCIQCHRRAGVAPDSPRKARPLGTRGYHGDKSPAEICRRAKFNITACTSCHSEGSCVQCHQVINPHPSGFEKRCKPLVRKNSRACSKCHKDNVFRRCQ